MLNQSEINILREDLGLAIECNDQLPPLSARIFATIILNGGLGITFDELVCDLQASKSSVSTNLKLLQNQTYITYFTKNGDRKKYYKIDNRHIIKSIEEKIIRWQKEAQLHERVLNHKKELFQAKKDTSNSNIEFNKLYIEYANLMVQQLLIIKQKISKHTS